VICVSDFTRRELSQLFRATADEQARMIVIPEGWEHLSEANDNCEKFSFEDGGYVFFLGSYRLHKNMTKLLKAFLLAAGRIPHRKKLVISGTSNRLSDADRALVQKINAEGDRVVFTGYVSTACVHRLYTHADAFIFPSLAEGFGLPVLEAFYCQTPLLCAGVSSLPEVAGDAALYFDPTDPAAIADAMVNFYSDPSMGAELIKKGNERLKVFSWTRTAEATVELYRECLAANGTAASSRSEVVCS
jgi:glycosyltransferase involved in cell wall biosynthesis